MSWFVLRASCRGSVVAKPCKFSHKLIFRKPQARTGVIDKRCNSHVLFHRLKCRGELEQDTFSRDSGSPSRVLSRLSRTAQAANHATVVMAGTAGVAWQ